MSGILQNIRHLLYRLTADRRGVGAVEFALIAPVLVVLYVGSFEVSVAMSVNKKLSRASSTIADIVTQQTEVDKNFLKTMIDVAESIVTPYTITNMKVKISGISIDAAKKAKVSWSWDEKNGQPYTPASDTTVPSELSIASTFLVRTEVEMQYSLVLAPAALGKATTQSLKMKKVYYLRQRIGDTITCKNCGPAA